MERQIPVGEVTLSVLEAGVGGAPLLLVHGFTGVKEDFVDEIEPLAALGYHVVAPDNRGHGASDQPDDEVAYSLELFASDAFELVDALGWNRFDLLGHSMGGMVAQLMVLDRQDRIDRLILMDTNHGALDGVDHDLLQAGVDLARSEGLAAVQEILKLGADPLENPAFHRICRERPGYQEWSESKMLSASAAMYASMLPQFVSADDRLAALGEVTSPTLVLVGELDEPFLKPSRRMAEAIPDAELVVLRAAGHSPQFEATDEWRAAVHRFVGPARGGA